MNGRRSIIFPASLFFAIGVISGGIQMLAQDTSNLGTYSSQRVLSYGGNKTGPLDACTTGCRPIQFTHWWATIPSLPGQRSDLVVAGIVTNCVSSLSQDKTATFTECGVTVERIIKKIPSNTIALNSTIMITREGGDVTVDGRTMASSIAGQALPQPMRKYILFLHYRPASDDYLILTSYEITAQGIKAVDEPPHFHLHDGQQLEPFISDIESSVRDESPFLRHHTPGGER